MKSTWDQLCAQVVVEITFHSVADCIKDIPTLLGRLYFNKK